MIETSVYNKVAPLGVLVVDDDPFVGESVRECFSSISEVEMLIEQVEKPREIKSAKIAKQEFSLIILDVVFQDDKTQIAYLLREAKKRWPGAVAVILSHYIGQLSSRQYEAADLVIDKTVFDLQPEILINKLCELAGSEKVGNNLSLIRTLEEYEKQIDPYEGLDLFRMTGYVIGEKGPHIEAVIHEEGRDGFRWRRVLMLGTLFKKKGLEGDGTPFVYRIFPEDDKVAAEVELNLNADEQADIPDDIEELIAHRDEQDERLRQAEQFRRESLNGK